MQQILLTANLSVQFLVALTEVLRRIQDLVTLLESQQEQLLRLGRLLCSTALYE